MFRAWTVDSKCAPRSFQCRRARLLKPDCARFRAVLGGLSDRSFPIPCLLRNLIALKSLILFSLRKRFWVRFRRFLSHPIIASVSPSRARRQQLAGALIPLTLRITLPIAPKFL